MSIVNPNFQTPFPLPPYEFQQLVCGPTPENTKIFEEVGYGLKMLLRRMGMLSSETDILDVGCGCGRVARFLVAEPVRSYVGFDRHPGMIEWCQKNIVDPRFTFQYFNLQSAYVHWDQHAGNESAAAFTFPYADDQFNAVMLSSVFTHMPPEEVGQYLKELRRIVRADGKMILSVFFSDREFYVDEAVNFFYPPDEFFALIHDAGFNGRLLDPFMADGLAPPDRAPRTDSHNWYLLK